MFVIKMWWGEDDLITFDDDVLRKGSQGQHASAPHNRKTVLQIRVMFYSWNTQIIMVTYVDSGASGCFSQPRIGTRMTRFCSRGSTLSADAMTVPTQLCEIPGEEKNGC